MSSPVPLTTPIKRGDVEVTEITLREPKSGELRGLDMYDVVRMNVNAMRTLVPRISNVTANEFDALSPKDLMSLAMEVSGFFTE